MDYTIMGVLFTVCLIQAIQIYFLQRGQEELSKHMYEHCRLIYDLEERIDK